MEQDNRNQINGENISNASAGGTQPEQNTQSSQNMHPEQTGQGTQQDSLYHYSYMNNKGDARFDRPAGETSQQRMGAQYA